MTQSMLVNARGEPEPPQDIVRRLRLIHPRLGLRYVPYQPQAWMVTMAWDENDPRREMVKRGEMSPDSMFDGIGYLPSDCPVDEAPAHLARAFRAAPTEEVQRLTDGIMRYNETVRVQASDEALDEVMSLPDPSAPATKVTGRRKKVPLPKP